MLYILACAPWAAVGVAVQQAGILQLSEHLHRTVSRPAHASQQLLVRCAHRTTQRLDLAEQHRGSAAKLRRARPRAWPARSVRSPVHGGRSRPRESARERDVGCHGSRRRARARERGRRRRRAGASTTRRSVRGVTARGQRSPQRMRRRVPPNKPRSSLRAAISQPIGACHRMSRSRPNSSRANDRGRPCDFEGADERCRVERMFAHAPDGTGTTKRVLGRVRAAAGPRVTRGAS